jgi:hypothetical protein
MRGKSAFEATQPPLVRAEPPSDCATRQNERLQFEAFMSRSGMRPKMEQRVRTQLAITINQHVVTSPRRRRRSQSPL